MDAEDALEQAFGHADERHFRWQTRSLGVATRESELVRRAFLPLGRRTLDLGSGEGATLYHLGEPEGAEGIELFPEKVRFARQHVSKCTFHQGSVYQLPFEGNYFDQLIVRDVIHHLSDPEIMLAECARVLKPGGRLDVLEPCRYNPLVLAHALTNRAEWGELKSTPSYLRQLIVENFRIESVERYQALPLHRIVYHPKLGMPTLVHRPWARTLVDATESCAARLLPRAMWAYIHVRSFLS